MAGKRIASSELNHDNWDEEYEHEEAGTFKRAPEDVISKRVIKTARRRNPIGGGEGGASSPPISNVFSNFGGFSKTATTTSASPFAFLSNITSTAQSNTNTNGLSSIISSSVTNASSTSVFKASNINSTTNEKSSPEKSSAYLTKLQGLNESVSTWIKTHVDKNPYCILTPIFKDYEKHLVEIENLKENETDKPSGFKLPTPVVNKTSQAATHSTSIFGKPTVKENENPFLSKPAEKEEKKETSVTSTTPTSGFSFGNSKLPTAPTSGFSFGSGTPFTFANVSKPPGEDKKPETTEDDEEPPKNEFTPVVEDDSIYSKRCKVFVKKDEAFIDRGVGQLFVKPVDGSEKVQVIVRQDTSLGNLIFNIVLSKSVPTQRMGKNNVMLVCIPDEKSKPPPVPVLLRVKTGEEADELLGILEKHKK